MRCIFPQWNAPVSLCGSGCSLHPRSPRALLVARCTHHAARTTSPPRTIPAGAVSRHRFCLFARHCPRPAFAHTADCASSVFLLVFDRQLWIYSSLPALVQASSFQRDVENGCYFCAEHCLPGHDSVASPAHARRVSADLLSVWDSCLLALPSNRVDRPHLKIPKSFAELQALNALLKKYRDIYPFRIVVCYVTTYLLWVFLHAGISYFHSRLIF